MWFEKIGDTMLKRRKGDKGHIIGCKSPTNAIELALHLRSVYSKLYMAFSNEEPSKMTAS